MLNLKVKDSYVNDRGVGVGILYIPANIEHIYTYYFPYNNITNNLGGFFNKKKKK